MLQIPKSENSEADSLAKSALETNQKFKELELTEELTKPSIEEEEVRNTQETTELMKSIILYLEHGILPKDKLKAQKLKIKAAHYSMYNGELYRRSLSHPWSKCVSPKKATMCSEKFTKGYLGLTKLKTPLSEKLCCKVTIGLTCQRMLFSSFKSVPSASSLIILRRNLPIFSIQLEVHGLLLYGEWTF